MPNNSVLHEKQHLVSLIMVLVTFKVELAGVYIGNEYPQEEGMFITERHCFSDLLEGLVHVA